MHIISRLHQSIQVRQQSLPRNYWKIHFREQSKNQIEKQKSRNFDLHLQDLNKKFTIKFKDEYKLITKETDSKLSLLNHLFSQLK